jgi:hypothetical protein
MLMHLAKKLLLFVAVHNTATFGYSQALEYKKKQTLVVNFMVNDYTTPQRIKNSSLGHVIRHSWSKISDMSPGLALNYYRGVSPHLDFMATFGGSFVDYSLISQQGSQNFLLETDASANYKFLADRYRISPYFTAGTGISKHSSRWGAYIPLGLGAQVRLSEDSFLFTNLQYRIGITNHTSDHINYAIGFGAPLGNQ